MGKAKLLIMSVPQGNEVSDSSIEAAITQSLVDTKPGSTLSSINYTAKTFKYRMRVDEVDSLFEAKYEIENDQLLVAYAAPIANEDEEEEVLLNPGQMPPEISKSADRKLLEREKYEPDPSLYPGQGLRIKTVGAEPENVEETDTEEPPLIPPQLPIPNNPETKPLKEDI